MSRPHNLLDLVGRRADSFSREEFAALPLLTSFTKSYLAGTVYQAGRAWTKTAAGWVCGVFPGETHDADVVMGIRDLVCIAVGEPKPDGRTLLTCRCCPASVNGWTDGSVATRGWRTITGIDGPNALCPRCCANGYALAGLVEEYADVHMGDAMPTRGDTVHALTVLDAILPLSKQPLHERAADLAYGTRTGRVPTAALEELGQAMHRIRRICVETGMSLSIVVAPDIAEVQILGAKPDVIAAVQVPNSDHRHYRDAAGTRFMWRA